MKDIFVGNIVKVFVSTDSTGELDFYSTKFNRVSDIAAFPVIQTKKETKNLEDYRQDFTSKLSGDISVSDVNLSVMSTNHPTSKVLDDALMNKQKLRFKITYEEDYVDESTIYGQIGTGLYHVFDAYVVKKSTSGANNAVVVDNYSLSVDGPVKRGYAEAGKILIVGDFGIGAGTDEVEGPKDLRLLTGNRWVTVDSGHSDNLYAAGTSLMSIQHPDGQGWQLIGSPVGNPSIRIRNLQKTAQGTEVSKWVKVYTELEKPTAKDVEALPIVGGELKGALIAQDITAKTVTQESSLVSKPQDTRANALTRKDYVDSEITKVKTSVSELDKTKADKTYTDTELSKKTNKTDFDSFKVTNTAEINKKADKTYTDTELSKKADKTYTDTELSKKSDIIYVDSEIAKVKSEIIGSDEFDKKLDKKTFNEYTESNDSRVQELFDSKATNVEVDKKLDKTDFDAFKVSNTEEINKKADKTDVDSKVQDLQTQIDNIAFDNLESKLDVTVFEEFKTENTTELNKIRQEFIPLNDSVIDFGEI
ncbi:hypothetical protein AB2B46_15330 [Kluyvera intermedia]|uniref:hypothetical protein n=1 Tax=Kluyvera intermedia TaxID=61648 RepID=UPI0034A51B22